MDAFTVWRELDPEETVRFFGLRLAEAKLIKSTPPQLLAGVDLSYTCGSCGRS